MTINLTNLQFLLPLLLPIPIAFLAGILRQDKFPDFVNEIIAWVVVFLAALLSVAFGVGGHLTGNAQLDFLTITAYSGLLVHSTLLKPMQMYLQSNLLSLGVSSVSKIEQTTIADVKASLDRLNAFFASGNVAQQPLTTASLATQATDVAIAEVQKVAQQAQQAAAQVQVPQFQVQQPQVAQVPFPQAMTYAPSSTYPKLPAVPVQ